ncbi:MAG TPA: hypothetical protein VLR50_13955 [Desulfobacterales bacterium]|nr:hypothetical protein [Desulfobacterales bacterium]
MKCRVCLPVIMLLILVMSSGTIVHSAMTGSDFMQAPQSYQNGFVSGFVRGMFMTCLDHLDTKKQVCSLDSVLDVTFDMTPEQVLDVFVNYLKKSSELEQKDVSELFIDCLKEIAKKTNNPSTSDDKK